MKVIIAGGRNIKLAEFASAMREIGDTFNLSLITEVVSGACPSGVDKLGEIYAAALGLPVKLFPADWDAHGPAAGPIRNRDMAHYGDVLFLIWDGESRGSGSMLKEMKALGKDIVEYNTLKRTVSVYLKVSLENYT